MSFFSQNPTKMKQIELQNIIFGTNEKKLMVSPEFLDDMTKHYISKRMKNINQMMESIFNTKSPKTFFTHYDAIIESLDELIAIEKHHSFKKPVPSAFKKNIEEKKEKYILAMINRVWKNVNMRANFDPTLGEKRDPKKFGPVLDELLSFRDKYTSAIFGHVDRFYKSVYGHGVDETPVSEEAANEEAAEAISEEIQEADLESEISADEAENMMLNE